MSCAMESVLESVLHRLRDRAEHSAVHCKPLMWAYHTTVADRLSRYFADVERSDGAIAGAALALAQHAEDLTPKIAEPIDAALTWAVGVYARRILAAWTGRAPARPSLDWLRERALGLFAQAAKKRGRSARQPDQTPAATSGHTQNPLSQESCHEG